MKINYIIIGLTATLLALGCSKSEDKTFAKQMSKTQDAAHEAALDLKSYTFEKKTEFVDYMNKAVAELDKNIEELSAKAEKSSDKVKAEAKPKIAALKEQASALKKKISSVSQSSPSTWSTIKAESSDAYEALKDGVVSSRNWLADKIAH